MKINYICNVISFGINSKNAHTGGRQPVQIYAVNPDTEECIKYESLSEMAKAHGVVPQVISSAYRSGYKIHGFIVKKSSDIEDKNGDVDRAKLLDVIKSQPRRGKRSRRSPRPKNQSRKTAGRKSYINNQKGDTK